MPEQATARIPPLIWNHNTAQKAMAFVKWPSALISVQLGIHWNLTCDISTFFNHDQDNDGPRRHALERETNDSIQFWDTFSIWLLLVLGLVA